MVKFISVCLTPNIGVGTTDSNFFLVDTTLTQLKNPRSIALAGIERARFSPFYRGVWRTRLGHDLGPKSTCPLQRAENIFFIF